jgi:tetratricopeptide (TPR) repeat protein
MATIPELMALGWRHHQEGDLARAAELYRLVLQADPFHIDAGYLYGAASQVLGRLSEAVAAYEQVLRLWPDHPEVLTNLGVALAVQGRWDEAVVYYRRALALKPAFPDAWSNLGRALAALGRAEEAAASFQNALNLRPDDAEALASLGNALREQGKLDEAEARYQDALRLRPDYAEVRNNLGSVFQEQGKLGEAEASYREALRLRPAFVEALTNLGNALREQGRPGEAAASYEEATRLRPDDAEARVNLGMTRLLMGDFERGWPEYEWRRRARGLPEHPSGRPRWDGTPLEGKAILLRAEQGLGDTIQFVRYAPMVRERGGVVLLECQPPLRALLADAPGVDRVVAPGGPGPEFAVEAPLPSLPGILGTTGETIPARVPYLGADAGRVGRWRRELEDPAGFRVGIVWRGNPKHPRDRQRSIPLVLFEPLAGLPGVRLVSLQKGPGAEQLDAPGWRRSILDLGGRLEDFADTAAVLANLDLLIACDTAVAHLAGALGLPAWVALPSDPDWRWLLGRDDSPWYPSLRLFRQDRPGDWGGVFGRIARELPSVLP